MSASKSSKILLVDDDPRVLASLVDLFKNDYEILSAPCGQDAITMAEKHADIATVVMDIKMEGIDGRTAARKIREIRPNTAIIFHTGYPGEYEEREIERDDKPFDYIVKGRSALQLMRSVRNGVAAFNVKSGQGLGSGTDAPNFGLIGRSAAMGKVLHDISKVASSDNKVMILGESGTGKELVAKAIHSESPRRDKPRAVLHCNHKSPDLVEAELFGHQRGAFTGAIDNRQGLFEYGDGGTVFLDEIGELDITTQAKLLRVLESGEYSRIGDPEIRKTDIRLLCATHKNLETMVKEGTFRQDLYYRLRGVQIRLPALRERKEDIPELVEYFAAKYSDSNGRPTRVLDQSAVDALVRHDWPGNVRDLKEAVEALLLMTDSDLIIADDVQAYLESNDETFVRVPDADGLTAKVEAYKRALVIQALRKTNGNISAAATILRMDKANLGKYIRERHVHW
jgi:two-component system, NtrC family, nitrogen regulation response regulator NtrX